jgi:hypothetical protein
MRVPSKHEARMLLQRVTHLRELISELEIDSVEWSCDADLRYAFAKVKQDIDEATLLLALEQHLRKH